MVPDRWEATPRRGERGGWIRVSYRFGVGFALEGRTKPPKATSKPSQSHPVGKAESGVRDEG